MIGGSLSARGSDDPARSAAGTVATRFIGDLGAAYRASGRKQPVMDMFSIHPYPENSSIPPDFEHPRSTAISLADPTSSSPLLSGAFDGTAPAGVRSRSSYGEYGLQTRIPPEEGGRIHRQPSSPPYEAIDEQQQADRPTTDAIEIAACSPATVRMLLFFHENPPTSRSSRRLRAGVFYARRHASRASDAGRRRRGQRTEQRRRSTCE